MLLVLLKMINFNLFSCYLLLTLVYFSSHIENQFYKLAMSWVGIMLIVIAVIGGVYSAIKDDRESKEAQKLVDAGLAHYETTYDGPPWAPAQDKLVINPVAKILKDIDLTEVENKHAVKKSDGIPTRSSGVRENVSEVKHIAKNQIISKNYEIKDSNDDITTIRINITIHEE